MFSYTSVTDHEKIGYMLILFMKNISFPISDHTLPYHKPVPQSSTSRDEQGQDQNPGLLTEHPKVTFKKMVAYKLKNRFYLFEQL